MTTDDWLTPGTLAVDRNKNVWVLVLTSPYGQSNQIEVAYGRLVSQWDGNESYPDDDPVVDCMIVGNSLTTHELNDPDTYSYPVSRLEPIPVPDIDTPDSDHVEPPSPSQDELVDDFTTDADEVVRKVRVILNDPLEDEVEAVVNGDEVLVSVARPALVEQAISLSELQSELESELPTFSHIELQILPRGQYGAN